MNTPGDLKFLVNQLSCTQLDLGDCEYERNLRIGAKLLGLRNYNTLKKYCEGHWPFRQDLFDRAHVIFSEEIMRRKKQSTIN